MRFTLIFGLIMMAGGAAMLVLGKARNGQPVAFLRSDSVQTYYALAMITLFMLGLINVLFGKS